MKPLASISLDADNLWSYMKTHGDAGWAARPTYLHIFVPAVLDALAELSLRITFFIVGADAADERNEKALRQLTRAGHEVGNHSFEHEPWLHTYPRDKVRAELHRADAAIRAATGQQPVGFRGPGFSWGVEVLETVAELGYRFDASTFPTWLGPLARAYYFKTSKLSSQQQEERQELFGTFSDGLRPLRPYLWHLPSNTRLLEIPVTTIPVFKVPFHLSYLIYLARYSEPLMIAYLRMAVTMCRLTGVAPSFLLHPLDLLGGDQISELRFFPGMDLGGDRKRHLFVRVLRELAKHFELVPMSTHADALSSAAGLAVRTPAMHAA